MWKPAALFCEWRSNSRPLVQMDTCKSGINFALDHHRHIHYYRSPSRLENPFQLANDFLGIYNSGWNFHTGWLFLSPPKFRQKLELFIIVRWLASEGGVVKAFFNTCSNLQNYTNLRPCNNYFKVVKHHLSTIITLQNFALPWRSAHSIKLWTSAKNTTFSQHGLPLGSLLA